jgi:hypothetical protein
VLRRSFEEAASQRQEAESRYQAAEDVVHQTINEVAELRRSWSWRLTAPLRAALDLVRSPKVSR